MGFSFKRLKNKVKGITRKQLKYGGKAVRVALPAVGAAFGGAAGAAVGSAVARTTVNWEKKHSYDARHHRSRKNRLRQKMREAKRSGNMEEFRHFRRRFKKEGKRLGKLGKNARREWGIGTAIGGGVVGVQAIAGAGGLTSGFLSKGAGVVGQAAKGIPQKSIDPEMGSPRLTSGQPIPDPLTQPKTIAGKFAQASMGNMGGGSQETGDPGRDGASLLSADNIGAAAGALFGADDSKPSAGDSIRELMGKPSTWAAVAVGSLLILS